MTPEEIQHLQAENESLRKELEHLKNEMIRLVSRNLDLSERLESDVELRRRAEVARQMMEHNLERQRNADLKDDAQLLALIELKMEQDRSHLNTNFSAADLAELLGVSQARLNRLFQKQTIYRTPEAYIDNLRVLTALRLLRERPQYTIAAIAEEAGFGNVRTLQRRIQDTIGMTPVEYRLMFIKG